MSDTDKSGENPREWLSPLEALARINTILKNDARSQRAIITRLRNGQIRAVAALRSEGPLIQRNFSIQKDAWGYFTGGALQQDFWHVGDFRIFIRARKHGETSKVIYFSTVSFDRADIEALVDSLPKLSTDISSEDSEWITPKETLEIVSDAIGNVAESIIMERLSGNLLHAIATRISIIDEGSEPEIAENSPIDAGLWSSIQNPRNFWDAGQARFYLRNDIYGARTITCTGILFLKKHIVRMFPAKEPKAQPPLENNTKPKGPPVSPAALEAWATAYRLAFQGRDDTLANAYASAEGCFPGKFVSRDSIRALVGGGRKRGPKS